MVKRVFQTLILTFIVLAFLVSSCAPARTPLPPTTTPTATRMPKTPTPMTTATETLDPETAIYTLAYALRDQFGNFDIVETDEGKQSAVFENGKVFELIDSKLVEIEIPSDISEKPEITPIFTQEVNKRFLGVQIYSKIITDESLQIHSTPSILKIIIADDVAAQFIARTIFKTWWVTGNIEHKDKPTEKDFRDFLALWSAAQNGKGSWEDVQFKIYANDLATRDYDQELVTIWPMFIGDAKVPTGVRTVNEINLVYVIGEYSTNRTILDDAFGYGCGANLNETALDLYVIPISTISGKNANPTPRSNRNIAGVTQLIPLFLVRNTGKPNWKMTWTDDNQLYRLLLTGLKAYTSKGAQHE